MRRHIQSLAYFTLKLALRLCRASGLSNPRGLAADAAGDIRWLAPTPTPTQAPAPTTLRIPLVALGPDSLDAITPAPTPGPDATRAPDTSPRPQVRVSFRCDTTRSTVVADIIFPDNNLITWTEAVPDFTRLSVASAKRTLLRDLRDYCDRDCLITITNSNTHPAPAPIG